MNTDSDTECKFSTELDIDLDYAPGEDKIREIGDYLRICESRKSSTDLPSIPSTSIKQGLSPESKVSKNYPEILNGTYFKIRTRSNEKVQALCIKCKKIIKGTLKTTTNFLKHLRNIHPKEYENYLEKKKPPLYSLKRKSSPSVQAACANISSLTRNEQPDIPSCRFLSQESFDKNLLRFITYTMSPIDIIEHPSFRALFEGTNYSIMSRPTAIREINEAYIAHTAKIRKVLSEVKHACTTADIWSMKSRTFLAVTCHWIDEDLKRNSVALSCKSFSGNHSYNIELLIADIHSNYELYANKIVATVTDSGSKYVNYFKEYGIQYQLIEGDNEIEDSSDDELLNFNKLLYDPVEFSASILPRRIRCFSHILNLIATTDVNKAINANSTLRSRHTNIMAKCNELWSKASRHKNAEIIQKYIGYKLSYPCVTRWNSLYDAIKSILSAKDQITVLFEKLEIKNQMNESDLEYLEEYCLVMAPLAAAVHLLQGEQNSFFGFVIPSLISLKVKYKKLKENNSLKYTNVLLNACIEGLNQRFISYYKLSSEVNEAIVAAVTLPNFKVRWFNGIKDEIENVYLNDIHQVVKQVAAYELKERDTQIKIPDSEVNELSEFFDFDHDNDGPSDVNVNGSTVQRLTTFELEYMTYLEDSRVTLSMLNDYPIIKKMFLKYNTCIPSSAPVGRLFSSATLMNSPRKSALNDENFEKLILLKANQALS